MTMKALRALGLIIIGTVGSLIALELGYVYDRTVTVIVNLLSVYWPLIIALVAVWLLVSAFWPGANPYRKT